MSEPPVRGAIVNELLVAGRYAWEVSNAELRAVGVDPAEYGPLSFIGVMQPVTRTFREEMAVHGKFGKPCPVCGTKVQRIVYAENESNYCPRCQTGGKLLSDRSLARLLKDDWPETIEELEQSAIEK